MRNKQKTTFDKIIITSDVEEVKQLILIMNLKNKTI